MLGSPVCFRYSFSSVFPSDFTAILLRISERSCSTSSERLPCASLASAPNRSESSMASSASMILPEPLSLFAPTTTRGTTSTFDCCTASEKRLSTCCVTWNCGPPYARTCSSVARACAIPMRATFSASASARARICAAC